MPRERRKERQTEDGPARAVRRGAARRRTMDGETFPPGFITVIFFSALRALDINITITLHS